MGSGFDLDFQHTLRNQSWSMYGVGMCLICLRMYARIHRVGIRALAPDDWFMVVAAGFYTTLIVCLNVIATGGGSNLFPPEQFSTFTEEDIKERIKGSKIVIVSEQAMLCVIYTLKTCLLFLYFRLTQGTHQNRWVKMVAVYVALGWVATETAFFTACRPFNGYWAVPPPDPQCTTLQHYAIVQACFNLSSDTMMLCIALPMVMSLKLPWKQKLVLGIVFSMGLFIIIAAILTKVYNLSNVYDTSYMLWYTREASVAVYVANLPLIWPVLREWFPFLRNMSSAQKSYNLQSYGRSRSNGQQQLQSQSERKSFDHPLEHLKSPPASCTDTMSLSASDRKGRHGVFERAIGKRNGSPASSDYQLQTSEVEQPRTFWGKGDIRTEVTIEVEREPIDLEKRMEGGHRRSMGGDHEWNKPQREVRIEGGSSV